MKSHAVIFLGGFRKIGSELFSTLSVHNYFLLMLVHIKCNYYKGENILYLVNL